MIVRRCSLVSRLLQVAVHAARDTYLGDSTACGARVETRLLCESAVINCDQCQGAGRTE
jgi:hypothetical protein